MPLASSFAAIYLGSLTMSIFAHDAAAGTLVVVPPGFDEVEGNRTGFNGPHYGETTILQEIHPASEFSGVPTGMTQMVGMRLRPDESVTSPQATSMIYELRLSTTDAVPGNLDPVLENNRGDDEVVVYQGPVVWATDAPGPLGGPQPFDYVVDFQRPFEYHSSLLVEEYFTVDDGSLPGYTDDHRFPDSLVRRNFAFVPADTAQKQSFKTSIRQFEFVPAPSGDIDGDGGVDGFDFIAWQRNPSLGNLSDWEANYGMGLPLSLAAAVPEPTAAALALTALVIAANRRRR